MPRSQQTPLGVVAQGLVAGAVGTAAMDLVQFARYRRGGGNDRLLAWEFSAGLKDWEQAPAPAHIGRQVVEGISSASSPRAGRARQQPDALGLRDRLGWAVRAGGGLAAFPKVRHGLALGASVWTASYVLLPLAKLYRPIWEYDARALARDLGDHLVSGLGAAGADRLLAGRRAG